MPEQPHDPRRPVSPERRAANRAYARKSTGPKTLEGKARSRANALQHGMTGQGVVQTPELEAEFEQKASAYEADLRPANQVERDLVRAAALGACRFELAARREFAAARTRRARADFDAAAALDATPIRLAADPAGTVRELTRSVTGLDWMIRAWTALRQTVAAGRQYWSNEEQQLAVNLLGLPITAIFSPALRELARADFTLSTGPQLPLLGLAAGLFNDRRTDGRRQDIYSRIRQDPPPLAQARATILRMVDQQLARLTALREALAPLETTAPDPAPPDDSAARLALRYESAARCTWHASLARLRSVRADRDDDPPAPAPNEPNEPEPPAPTNLAPDQVPCQPVPVGEPALRHASAARSLGGERLLGKAPLRSGGSSSLPPGGGGPGWGDGGASARPAIPTLTPHGGRGPEKRVRACPTSSKAPATARSSSAAFSRASAIPLLAPIQAPLSP